MNEETTSHDPIKESDGHKKDPETKSSGTFTTGSREMAVDDAIHKKSTNSVSSENSQINLRVVVGNDDNAIGGAKAKTVVRGVTGQAIDCVIAKGADLAQKQVDGRLKSSQSLVTDENKKSGPGPTDDCCSVGDVARDKDQVRGKQPETHEAAKTVDEVKDAGHKNIGSREIQVTNDMTFNEPVAGEEADVSPANTVADATTQPTIMTHCATFVQKGVCGTSAFSKGVLKSKRPH
ncbi:MAG: hypothetical protein AAGM67_10760, partial [Bacteroidota bacterium]